MPGPRGYPDAKVEIEGHVEGTPQALDMDANTHRQTDPQPTACG